ncbi:MAG: hypothetical protein V9G10_08770 [Candidatus Nanopelagicales bacterium]
MPEDWADYPPYYQVAQYFEDFADHFGLRAAHHVQHRGREGRAGRRPLAR